MNFEDARKWVSAIALVIIAGASLVTAFNVGELRKSSTRVAHAVDCDEQSRGGPREGWPPLCNLRPDLAQPK